jgi:hypothetical protein
VNTLYEEGIKFGNLLTTDPELEDCWVRGTGREKPCSVCSGVGDTFVFNPYVTQKITLGSNWNGNFVARTKRTDVIHTLWLYRKICVSFIVLSKETDLGLTSDVHILSTFTYKVNQGG